MGTITMDRMPSLVICSVRWAVEIRAMAAAAAAAVMTGAAGSNNDGGFAVNNNSSSSYNHHLHSIKPVHGFTVSGRYSNT